MITFLQHTPFKFLTESLWRDEAFSWAMASRGLEILPLTARDFNPPLYYLLLNLWMQLLGTSELALRSLSLIFYLGTVWVVWRFMIDLLAVPSRRAAIYLLLFALNPVLTYYAMEARMYSLLAFLAAASIYSYQAGRPILYVVSTAAGLYTHYFMFLVIGVQALAAIVASAEDRDWRRRVLLLAAPVLLVAPWLAYVAAVRGEATTTFWIAAPGWRFAVHVLTAVYTGHEAMYGVLSRQERWAFALCLVPVALWSLHSVRRSAPHHRAAWLLVALWAIAPPALIFAVSFVKPLFLPRYLVFSTVGLLLLLVCGLERARAPLRFALLVLLGALAVHYQIAQARHHSKGRYRDTIRQIVAQAGPEDLLYVRNELDFFPAQYYFGEARVFVFGRPYDEIPPYVGKVLIPRPRVVSTTPPRPARVFLLQNDREFVGLVGGTMDRRRGDGAASFWARRASGVTPVVNTRR